MRIILIWVFIFFYNDAWSLSNITSLNIVRDGNYINLVLKGPNSFQANLFFAWANQYKDAIGLNVYSDGTQVGYWRFFYS